jgi:hypothetical protein
VGECSRIRGPQPRQIFLQGLRSIEQARRRKKKPRHPGAARPNH